MFEGTTSPWVEIRDGSGVVNCKSVAREAEAGRSLVQADFRRVQRQSG